MITKMFATEGKEDPEKRMRSVYSKDSDHFVGIYAELRGLPLCALWP